MEKGWKEKGECLPGLADKSDGEKAGLATSDGEKVFQRMSRKL